MPLTYCNLLKSDFLYRCAASNKISNDTAYGAINQWELLLLLLLPVRAIIIIIIINAKFSVP